VIVSKLITCRPKRVPEHKAIAAADKAVEHNPANHVVAERLIALRPGFKPTKQEIALLRTKYWGAAGVRLTVGFLDSPSTALRNRILLHLNAWSRNANVVFVESHSEPQVRIARTSGDGHWSYVGTDILVIPHDEPTMNLDSFTMDTPESEFHRVVRHEAGHTLGFIHEHMRRALVQRIDEAKAIAFFRETQGWPEPEVRAQVLTPIEESSLRGTTPDPNSIMCYQLPGEITIDGEPILGGTEIDELDHALVGRLYPRPAEAPIATHESRHVNGGAPLIFLTNAEPSYVAAVIAATRGV
jgi:Astacin (Peptidase family M12A)